MYQGRNEFVNENYKSDVNYSCELSGLKNITKKEVINSRNIGDTIFKEYLSWENFNIPSAEGNVSGNNELYVSIPKHYTPVLKYLLGRIFVLPSGECNDSVQLWMW